MDFPRATADAAIRDEITAANNDRPVPKGAWEPEVCSLVMVRIGLRMEEELGIELPNEAMPAGGYDDVETCVQTVLAHCEEIWLKTREKEGTPVS